MCMFAVIIVTLDIISMFMAIICYFIISNTEINFQWETALWPNSKKEFSAKSTLSQGDCDYSRYTSFRSSVMFATKLATFFFWKQRLY